MERRRLKMKDKPNARPLDFVVTIHTTALGFDPGNEVADNIHGLLTRKN